MTGKTKALAVLFCIALCSTAVYAHEDDDADHHDFYREVVVPNLKPGFQFNIAALWLRPGASNLNYVIFNKELPAQSPTWTEREIGPYWSPGFELGVGYVFPNCEGQDVRLTWTHLHTSDTSSTRAPNESFFLGPDYEIGPAGIPIRNATGKAKFTYNVVNLDVGQYVNFGHRVLMRFFGGLSAVNLEEEVISTYTGTTPEPFPGPFSMTQDSTSRFRGIGPRFGIAANYDTKCGYGFIGNFAVSALIGSMNSRTNFTGSGDELLEEFDQEVNHQFIRDQTVTQVIPGLDTKLGVYYQGCFLHNVTYRLTAGYQAAVYVNAISQYLPQTLVEGTGLETGGIFVATMAHRVSNYSVQGPFLEFAVSL